MPRPLRILVTGAGGQLGRSLQDLAQSSPQAAIMAFADRQGLDISRADSIAAWLADQAADVIINAAAYTAVDRAATEPAQAIAANTEAPGLLAQACAQRGMRLIHVSTDYVFDGRAGRPYTEDDPTNPLNTYGRSKLEGEQRVLAHAPDSIIVRTGWVFSAHGGNFVKTMLRLAQARDTLHVIDDQLGIPTWAGDLARVLLALAVHPDFPPGIFHFSSTPPTSWHGFAQEILAQAHARGLIEQLPTLHPIASRDWPAPEPRPADSRLDGSRLAGLLGLEPCDWRLGLARTLDALAPTRDGLQ